MKKISNFLIWIFLLISTVNYWFILLTISIFFIDMTVDTDALTTKNGIYPGTSLLMFIGLGVGPILSVALSMFTYVWLKKLSELKKYILFGIHILFIGIFLFWINVSQ